MDSCLVDENVFKLLNNLIDDRTCIPNCSRSTVAEIHPDITRLDEIAAGILLM
jgi:hypothetical protein